jgi:hypothetical protein
VATAPQARLFSPQVPHHLRVLKTRKRITGASIERF